MSKRTKNTIAPIQTREEAEALIGDLSRKIIERDAWLAEMDSQLLEIRTRYEKAFAEADTAIKIMLLQAQDWAEHNKPLFDPKKSLDMLHAVVGFRTGMPKLITLKGWTWKKVLANLVEKGIMAYVRSTDEIDKETLLNMRELMSDKDREAIGVKVDQEESFFVEPKREAIPQEK